MLNAKICELQEKLNKSIAQGKSYDEIYKLSVELDKLIYKYYTDNPKNNNKNKKQLQNKKNK